MPKVKAKVINLLAGPGVGKTSVAWMLGGLMKKQHISVDIAAEFAQDLAYRGIDPTKVPQPVILGEQMYRIHTRATVADYVITDSSLLYSLIYKQDYLPDSFDKSVIDIYNIYDNINIIVRRNKDKNFAMDGRVHNKEQSEEIQGRIEQMVQDLGLPHFIYNIDDNDDVQPILDYVLREENVEEQETSQAEL